MSAKWSVQPVKGTVVDADVLLIIDSEAGPVDNKQVLFSTIALASQSPWRGNIDAATFNLDNLESVDFNNALGTNPNFSALQSASESTIILGSNFQISSGYIDIAEITTPTNPAADVGRLYVKDDGGGITNLFFRDSTGTETDLVSSGTGGHIIEDETSPLTQRPALNFIGAGVVATDNAGTDATDVTISGGTGHIIEDEATPLTQRPALNFIGSSVTVTDNAGTDATDVTISGGGASPLTTKGDLFGFDSADARIPVGVDGQVLTADSVESLGVKWETPSGGGGIEPSLFFSSNELIFLNGDTDIYTTLGFNNSNSLEAQTQFEVPVDTNFSEFVLVVGANNLDGAFTITLRVNGASSAITMTVPAAQTGTFTSSGPVALSQGDLVNWLMDDGGATTGELEDGVISFSMPSGVGGDDPTAFFGLNDLIFSFNETNIYRTLDFTSNTATESENQFQIPVDTNFSNFTFVVLTNTLDENFTLTLRVNGVSTSTITVGAAQTGTFTSSTSVLLSKGDLVNWLMTTEGATSGELEDGRISFSMPFESRGIGTPIFFGSSQLNFTFGATNIYRAINFSNSSSVEASAQFTIPVDTSFSVFTLDVPQNDLNQELTLTLRVNGVSTDVVITVDAGEPGTFTSPVSIPLSQNDLVNWLVNDGGATSGELQNTRISFSMPTSS